MNEKNTQEAMQRLFSVTPQVTVRAPGRVNLIGEHTDYNAGFVLPCAINFFAEVSITPRKDHLVRLCALDYAAQQDSFSLRESIAHVDDGWANYARGVVDVLQKQYGPLPTGFDAVIAGNVPQGAGLSSSAAYEVAFAKALSECFALDISSQAIALLAQRAENEFVGCQCGIMDQLISAQGAQNAALLIDCQTLTSKHASIPEDWAVVIVNSNVKRGLVDSEYNLRREQCEAAARILGVDFLRAATLAQLEAAQGQMDEVTYRRARHVITDSARAEALAEAMPAKDMAKVRELMRQSHASMRDDFEITHPAVDALVEIIAEAVGEQGGARMTGGGFGGCVVALVENSAVDKVRNAVLEQYPARTGLVADFYVCQASEGVHVI